ncbi:hypothetical protein [Kitasatospora sp. NPDC093558]|uniref:hypothetical protein n=1 Tax=Kitasatospora sp. NPDC093558 TaxID=3155201 RepID=UPI003421B2D1
MRILVADAFGTYAVGPAYACSLVLLRLDLAPTSQGLGQLAQERAQMVREIVRTLDLESTMFDHVVQALALDWEDFHGQPPQPSEREPEPLLPDPGEVKERLDAAFPALAYTIGDWQTAESWGRSWLTDLRNTRIPRLPEDVVARRKLRDALNAAWYARVANPAGADSVGSVTHQLCKTIIKTRSETMENSNIEAASWSNVPPPRRDIVKDRAREGDY